MKRIVALAVCLFPMNSLAHEGIDHSSRAEAAAHRVETAVASQVSLDDPSALPFDLGGSFDLTDHTGTKRSQVDPDGLVQLLFFGYANCPSICAIAMPMMAELTDALGSEGHRVRPLMVTVDPKRDTVANMEVALAEIHEDFVGLTGTEDQLAQIYDAFQVSHEIVFHDPQYGAVYAHGSHIYLLDGNGEVLTLIPPILGVARAKAIVANYLDHETSR